MEDRIVVKEVCLPHVQLHLISRPDTNLHVSVEDAKTG